MKTEKPKAEKDQEKPQAAEKQEKVYKKKEVLQKVAAPVGEQDKENSSVLMNSTNHAGSASNSEVERLQVLVLQKEKEIIRMQKTIDKQDKQIAALEKDQRTLAESTSAKSEAQLQEQIVALHAQLKKQMQLNRLQAAQILEFEKQGWQQK